MTVTRPREEGSPKLKLELSLGHQVRALTQINRPFVGHEHRHRHGSQGLGDATAHQLAGALGLLLTCLDRARHGAQSSAIAALAPASMPRFKSTAVAPATAARP